MAGLNIRDTRLDARRIGDSTANLLDCGCACLLIGRTAMTMLFERLDRPDGAPRRVVLGGRCIVRGSSAGPSARPGGENVG